MMDGMDGFKFVEIIRKNTLYAHIPIIFLTAKNSNEDQLKAYDSGAIDYITKPFTTQKLLTKIKNLFDLLECRKQIIANSLLENAFNKPAQAGNEQSERLEPDHGILELSNRESEIASLLIEGFTNSEISQKLYISDRTVGKHVQNIYKKLEVKNRSQLTKRLNKI